MDQLKDYHKKDNPEGIKTKDCKFNDFYWGVNRNGTLCVRWMDNNFVFCVSTVHRPGKMIKRVRRKPRITNNNRAHVEEIWGKDGKKEIFIPVLIDDYNHWMGGVDLSDQRIAYYQPDLRCRRTWIPLFIQLLSLTRNNAYHVHKEDALKKT